MKHLLLLTLVFASQMASAGNVRQALVEEINLHNFLCETVVPSNNYFMEGKKNALSFVNSNATTMDISAGEIQFSQASANNIKVFGVFKLSDDEERLLEYKFTAVQTQVTRRRVGKITAAEYVNEEKNVTIAALSCLITK